MTTVCLTHTGVQMDVELQTEVSLDLTLACDPLIEYKRQRDEPTSRLVA